MTKVLTENLGDAKIMILSQVGKNHIKSNAENQDSYAYRFDKSIGYAFAVADGVGSCVNAKKGSETACKVICDLLQAVENKTEDEIRKFLFYEWKNRIGKDLNNFCSTLNFCYIFKHRVIIGKIGDGAVILKDGNTFHTLFSESEFYTSETFALGEVLPKAAFEISIIERKVSEEISLLMITDGIAKEIEYSKKDLFASYIFSNIQNENFVIELQEWIDDLDKKNGDDKTIFICDWKKK